MSARPRLPGLSPRLLLAALPLLPAIAGCNRGRFPDVPPGYREFAYVSNGASNTVSVLDLVYLRQDRTLQVGSQPTGIAVNPVRNEVYVVNTLSGNRVRNRHREKQRGRDHPGPQASLLHRRRCCRASRVRGQQRIEHGERNRPGQPARDRRGGYRRAARPGAHLARHAHAGGDQSRQRQRFRFCG